jgi:hypothetical protein
LDIATANGPLVEPLDKDAQAALEAIEDVLAVIAIPTGVPLPDWGGRA